MSQARARGSNTGGWEAQLGAEVVVMRRAMGSAWHLSKKLHTPRRVEAYWVLLESVWATVRGETLTQKKLVAAAHGIWSQATISRVIGDLQKEGYINIESADYDNRILEITATNEAIQFILNRAKTTSALLAGFD